VDRETHVIAQTSAVILAIFVMDVVIEMHQGSFVKEIVESSAHETRVMPARERRKNGACWA
jgi:hypothetical protein